MTEKDVNAKTIWTNEDRNALYQVTKGIDWKQTQVEDMYNNGDFDSWKGERTYTSIFHLVRRQHNRVGNSMNGVVIQPGVEINEGGVQKPQKRKPVQKPQNAQMAPTPHKTQQRDRSGDKGRSHKRMTPAQKAQKTRSLIQKPQKRDYSHDTRPNHKAMTPAQKQQNAQERERNKATTPTPEPQEEEDGEEHVVESTSEEEDGEEHVVESTEGVSAVEPTEAAQLQAAFVVAADMLMSMVAPNAAPSDEASEDVLSMETQDGTLDNPSMSPNSVDMIARLSAVAKVPGASDDESSMEWMSTTGRRGGGRSGGSAGANDVDLWDDEPILAPKRSRFDEVSNDNLQELSSMQFDAVSAFFNETSATPTVTPLLVHVMPTADVQAEVLLFEPLTAPVLEAPLEFRSAGPPPQVVEKQAPVERAQARVSLLPFAMIPTSRAEHSRARSIFKQMSNNTIRRGANSGEVVFMM